MRLLTTHFEERIASLSVWPFFAKVKALEADSLLLLTKETQYLAGEIVRKAELALYFRVGGEQLLVEPDQTGTEPAIVWSSLVIRGARSKASGGLLRVIVKSQAFAGDSIRRTNGLGIA